MNREITNAPLSSTMGRDECDDDVVQYIGSKNDIIGSQPSRTDKTRLSTPWAQPLNRQPSSQYVPRNHMQPQDQQYQIQQSVPQLPLKSTPSFQGYPDIIATKPAYTMHEQLRAQQQQDIPKSQQLADYQIETHIRTLLFSFKTTVSELRNHVGGNCPALTCLFTPDAVKCLDPHGCETGYPTNTISPPRFICVDQIKINTTVSNTNVPFMLTIPWAPTSGCVNSSGQHGTSTIFKGTTPYNPKSGYVYDVNDDEKQASIPWLGLHGLTIDTIARLSDYTIINETTCEVAAGSIIHQIIDYNKKRDGQFPTNNNGRVRMTQSSFHDIIDFIIVQQTYLNKHFIHTNSLSATIEPLFIPRSNLQISDAPSPVKILDEWSSLATEVIGTKVVHEHKPIEISVLVEITYGLIIVQENEQ